MRKINAIEYLCAVPPQDETKEVQDAFWYLWKNQGDWVSAEAFAEEAGIPESMAHVAFNSMLRDGWTLATTIIDDDDVRRYTIPKEFFRKSVAGTTLCVVCRVLTVEERDVLNEEADEMMKRCGLKFVGNVEDEEEDEEEDAQKPPSRRGRKPLSMKDLRLAMIEHLRGREGFW